MSEDSDDVGDVSGDEFDLDALASRLEADRIGTRSEAVAQCLEYANEDPSVAENVVDLLVDRLDDEAIAVSQRAAESISEIASERPETATQAADPLVDVMRGDSGMGQFYAAAAIRPIAAHRPTLFASRIDDMIAILQDGVAESVEHTGAEAVSEEFKESLDNMSRTETQSQMAAHGILANVIVAIAEERPDQVAPYLDELTSLLEADVELVVVTILDAIALIARHDPDLAGDAVDDIVSVLDHHDEGARAQAVKALGYIGDPSTADVLRGVAKTDSSDDVRALADETVDFLD